MTEPAALSANPNLVAEAYPAIQNLPEPTLSEIARVSEGNPYFMEEIVKTLMNEPFNYPTRFTPCCKPASILCRQTREVWHCWLPWWVVCSGRGRYWRRLINRLGRDY